MKGDKESNGLIDNVAAWNHSNIKVPHWEQDTQEPLNEDSLVMPWLPFERLHGKKPTRPVRRKGAGKKDHHRSDEQDEPQISIRNLAWNAKQHSELAKSGEWNLTTGGTQKQSTM